jgi:hypothetical protein
MRPIVLAFYSNPTFSPQITRPTPANPNGRFLPLQSLSREMRHTLSTTHPFDFRVLPATTWENMRQAVEMFKPMVLLWSGHTISFARSGDPLEERALVFETDNGRVDRENLIDGARLREELEQMDSVKLICLMGCYTTGIVADLPAAARKGRRFISWSTQLEDTAALAFMRGVVNALKQIIVEWRKRMRIVEWRKRMTKKKSASNVPLTINAQAVFDQGCAEFKDAGFRRGDPDTTNHMTQGEPHLL